MKNIRFYQEFSNKRKKISTGTCIAINYSNRNRDGTWFAFASPHLDANEHVATSSVCDAYLRANCKRVSERKAREIHPRLFLVLDG